MLNDYYNIVRKLVDHLHTTLQALSQQHYFMIPTAQDLCSELEFALCHSVISKQHDSEILEQIKCCEKLYTVLNDSKISMEVIQEKIFFPYNIQLIYSKITSDLSLSEDTTKQSAINSNDDQIPNEEDTEFTEELSNQSYKNGLLVKGYSEKEIELYLKQGISSLVLKKLADPSLKLTTEQSIECIKTCIAMGEANLSLIENQSIVLFLGDSGSGKSTVLNYLHGCTVIKNSSGQLIVNPESKLTEIAFIGHHLSSKTFIPQIVRSTHTGLIFCDNPGFNDNRGSEINISNSVNIRRILSTARSVKIILLLSYESIFTSRGKAVAELKKSMSLLCGEAENLKNLSKSILIGITKAPLSIDDNFVTIQGVRKKLFDSGELPEELKSQTYIIDPLERNRPNYALSRREWLEHIKELIPIEKSHQTFNTILNVDDKLFILEISKNISNKINCYIKQGKFKSAAFYLSLLARLKIINHNSLDEYISDNLLNIFKYVSVEEQKISELSKQAHFQEAEKKLNEMKRLVSNFQTEFPEFKFEFSPINDYLLNNKINNELNHIVNLLNELKKEYYGCSEDIGLMSEAIIQVVDKIKLEKDRRLDTIVSILTEFQKLPKIAQISAKLLKKINDFTERYTENESLSLFQSVILECTQELKGILESAKKIHKDFIINKNTHLKLCVSDNLRFISEELSDPTIIKEFLLKVINISENIAYSQLQKLLVHLSEVKFIQPYLKFISLALNNLHRLGEVNADREIIESQVKLVSTCLLNLKEKLQILQEQKQKEEREEREKQKELEIKFQEEQKKLESHTNKINELENAIKNQMSEMVKEEENEKQAQLKFQELMRKNEELARESEERDKILEKKIIQKIIKSTTEDLRNAFTASVSKRRVERQTSIKQRRLEILKKRQEFKELRKKLGLVADDSIESDEEENSEFNVQPQLSDMEIEEIAKKEVDNERALIEDKIKIEKEQMINEFQKKLNNIEDLRKNSAITSGEIFRQYEVLEKTALQLREAKFYLSRGNFFYESAENENNKSSQQGLYHYALKNYKKALEYNSQLENLAERIKQLETLLNVKLISQGEKQKFFAPTSATLEEKENTLKKEELTEEQLKDYDRVKALFYKFATSMNKS